MLYTCGAGVSRVNENKHFHENWLSVKTEVLLQLHTSEYQKISHVFAWCFHFFPKIELEWSLILKKGPVVLFSYHDIYTFLPSSFCACLQARPDLPPLRHKPPLVLDHTWSAPCWKPLQAPITRHRLIMWAMSPLTFHLWSTASKTLS